MAVWHGLYSYTISEREKNWTFEDDIDFSIACYIKDLRES